MKTRRRRSLSAALALLAAGLLGAGSAYAVSPIVYEQYDNASTSSSGFVSSSDYCDPGNPNAPCTFYMSADDFFVPSRHTWTVDQVEVEGEFSTSLDLPRGALQVRFFANSTTDAPGELLATERVPAGSYTGDRHLLIPLTSPVRLTAGHYWVSVQADVQTKRVCPAWDCAAYNVEASWYWRLRTVVSGSGARTDERRCDWCALEDGSGNPQDLVFRLRGTDPRPVVGEAREQRVAVAPDGRAVLTWLRWDGQNWIVQARARAADGTLSAVHSLSPPNEDAASPQVAIDNEGDAVLAWVRSNGTNQVVQARARSAAGTLSTVQTLSAAGQDAAVPRVGVDADGDAVFGWIRRNGENWIAQARARSAAGALAGIHTLSSSGADASSFGLGVDADGDAVFAWQRAGVVQTRRRAADTGAVSLTQNVSPSGSSSPRVGVDQAGNAIFSWTSGGFPQALNTRRRSVDGTFSAPQAVSPVGSDVLNAYQDVESDGDSVFVWESVTYNGDDVYIAIRARRRAADGTLSSTNTVATSGTTPSVAIDGDGDAIFTWVGGLNGQAVVRARRRAQDGTLSVTQAVATGGEGVTYPVPQVGVDAAGNAVFTWLGNNGSWTEIQGRSRAEAGALSAIFTASN